MLVSNLFYQFNGASLSYSLFWCWTEYKMWGLPDKYANRYLFCVLFSLKEIFHYKINIPSNYVMFWMQIHRRIDIWTSTFASIDAAISYSSLLFVASLQITTQMLLLRRCPYMILALGITWLFHRNQHEQQVWAKLKLLQLLSLSLI